MGERCWDVVPGVGVGPVRLGASRDELRVSLGRYRAFRRGAYSVDLTDQYVDADLLMLTCSADEGLYLIEVPDPQGLSYRGVHLAGRVEVVVAALRSAGVEPVADGGGGWAFADGAVVVSTRSTEPDAVVDAVTVFAAGHESGGELVRFPGGDAGVRLPNTYRVISGGRGLDTVRFGESRGAVRGRLRGGLCWRHRAGSREPVQDIFVDDGLVVQYGPDDLVERIFVTRADEVMFGEVNLKPAYPHTITDVRDALTAAGHVTVDGEAGTTLVGTGLEIWIGRADAEVALPVSCVSLSGATSSTAAHGSDATLF